MTKIENTDRSIILAQNVSGYEFKMNVNIKDNSEINQTRIVISHTGHANHEQSTSFHLESPLLSMNAHDSLSLTPL